MLESRDFKKVVFWSEITIKKKAITKKLSHEWNFKFNWTLS